MEETKVTEANAVETTEVVPGAFISSLKRNNTKIRADRAEAIAEDAQLIFKRTVEDIAVDVKRMERELENMLDLSPTNSMSLIVASDFDSASFVSKDIELGVRIRNAKIKLEIAKARYKYLFGEDL
jgi:hypothetical protein